MALLHLVYLPLGGLAFKTDGFGADAHAVWCQVCLPVHLVSIWIRGIALEDEDPQLDFFSKSDAGVYAICLHQLSSTVNVRL